MNTTYYLGYVIRYDSQFSTYITEFETGSFQSRTLQEVLDFIEERECVTC